MNKVDQIGFETNMLMGDSDGLFDIIDDGKVFRVETESVVAGLVKVE